MGQTDLAEHLQVPGLLPRERGGWGGAGVKGEKEREGQIERQRQREVDVNLERASRGAQMARNSGSP